MPERRFTPAWFRRADAGAAPAWTRRAAIAATAASLAEIAAAASARRASAAPGEAGDNQHCRKNAQSCRHSAQTGCRTYYPEQYDECTSDLFHCCDKAAHCQIKQAKRCWNSSKWVRGASLGKPF